MNFVETPLQGSYEIELNPITDERGWFVRTFCKKDFENIGHKDEWLQTNHSFTTIRGAIRGIHFQASPFAEVKLVRCITGRVFDVIVDIRKHSATFLKWHGVELSSRKMNMLYIPRGFAHGFQTLTANCQLLYYHSEIYSPAFERGLRYDDPVLSIQWPMQVSQISQRDNNHPLLTNDFAGI